MNRTALATICLLILCAAAPGQTAYRGLTPGRSTRADVERVLGRPVKNVSGTLSEYDGRPDVNKIYVQYSDESPAAGVLRIELHCEMGGGGDSQPSCIRLYAQLTPKSAANRRWDAYIVSEPDARYSANYVIYHGTPAFIVKTYRQSATDSSGQVRLGFYSRELYEVALPKSCTGTFAGVWETNRGRVTFNRTPEAPAPKDSYADNTNMKGSYSTGNGTITGLEFSNYFKGEWKDATGGGTMDLKIPDLGPRTTFTGTWTRTSGKGPREGTWEGRCVEVKDGGND